MTDPLAARDQSHGEKDGTEHQMKDVVPGVQKHGAEVPRPIHRRVSDGETESREGQIKGPGCYAEALRRRCSPES